jgi:hypothetical protein
MSDQSHDEREAGYKALLNNSRAATAIDTKTLLDDEQRVACETHIRSVQRVCRGPLDPQHQRAAIQLIEEGRREEASAMDAAGRDHCGADFNDVVVAGPWDGAMREYSCPSCEKTGKYAPPTFTVEYANALIVAQKVAAEAEAAAAETPPAEA